MPLTGPLDFKVDAQKHYDATVRAVERNNRIDQREMEKCERRVQREKNRFPTDSKKCNILGSPKPDDTSQLHHSPVCC